MVPLIDNENIETYVNFGFCNNLYSHMSNGNSKLDVDPVKTPSASQLRIIIIAVDEELTSNINVDSSTIYEKWIQQLLYQLTTHLLVVLLPFSTLEHQIFNLSDLNEVFFRYSFHYDR